MSRTVLRGAYVLQGAGLTFERRPLDVVVEGERIAAVEPANSVAVTDHVVDLSRRLLVPGLISLLPSGWQDDISPYLPSNAGQSMFALHQDATALSPATGLLVFLGWTVLGLAGAAWRLARSDA